VRKLGLKGLFELTSDSKVYWNLLVCQDLSTYSMRGPEDGIWSLICRQNSKRNYHLQMQSFWEAKKFWGFFCCWTESEWWMVWKKLFGGRRLVETRE